MANRLIIRYGLQIRNEQVYNCVINQEINMPNKNRLNFWVDLITFVLFALNTMTGLLLWFIIPSGSGSRFAVFGAFTRAVWLTLHKWLGLGVLGGVATHLAIHWQWILCVGRRCFDLNLAQQVQKNLWLDILLGLAFGGTSLSGLILWLVLPSGGWARWAQPIL